MKALLRRRFLALAIIALAVPANAGPWEDGEAAYDRGDYETALKLWRPLAEQGDIRAQTNLSFMYRTGTGVPKDFAEAKKWDRKAAEQGKAPANAGRIDDGLPDHTVEMSSLAPKTGKRVQVTVKIDITESECVSLISAYQSGGKPDGQVSVHKPSNIKALAGALVPWCVENFNGQGIVFNRYYFE